MNPPKIALIRQKYREDGGAERFVNRALEALGRSDLDVTLIARKWTGGNHYNHLKCDPFHLGRLWRDRSFSNCVCSVVNSKQFSLVQSHERLACCDLYRAGDGVHREWLKQRSRVLSALHNMAIWITPYHRYVMNAEKRMFESKQLKAVICNSKMVRDEITGYFNIPADKIHVIYSGIDTQLFNPSCRSMRKQVREKLKLDDKDTVFLFVGSGFERKGLNTLLHALSGLPSTAKAIVVGADKRRTKYEQKAKKLKIEDRCLFLGKQPDVIPFYATADALVLPTLYDPFPNVILEAMACGLPVLTSTKSGGAEMITQGIHGYVHDALDYKAFTASMEKLMVREHSFEQGLAAREKIEPYTLAFMAENLNNLYSSLLSHRSNSFSS